MGVSGDYGKISERDEGMPTKPVGYYFIEHE
jgi:hypothetical protein